MCHTGAMRYGHFATQDLNRADLQHNPLSDCWQLSSPFTKYPTGEPHVIRYFDSPRQPCAHYDIITPMGWTCTVSASKIISWYLQVRDSRFNANGGKLFPTMTTKDTDEHTANHRRHVFTTFLRHTFTAAIPGFAHRMLLRPHGLRAGWVTDRRREGTPNDEIKREGRWSSVAAMNIYDRTCFRDVCPSSTINFCRHPDMIRNRRRRR